MINTTEMDLSQGQLMRKVPELSLMSYLNGNQSDKNKFVDSLFKGLKEYGFIILTDHPVEQEKVDRFYQMVKSFFSLPLETKMKYSTGKNQRGYIPFGMEHAKGNENPDLKEFWHVGREIQKPHAFEKYYPDNIWPSELPEFKALGLELYQAMDMTSKVLLEAIGIALDVPADFFVKAIADGNSILRAIHYPPVKGLDTDRCVRAAAHGDINLITMLVGATDSGLELLDRDGQWLPVMTSPGQIVVDTGDMMSRWTNEVLPSTIHRVVNPKGDNSTRFSMPYFVHPHPEALISCLPSCKAEGALYPDITSHQFLMQRLEEIGLSY